MAERMTVMTEQTRWYLIYTKPAAEQVACTHLARQEYQIYLPRIIEPIRRRGLWRERIAALFPRYLFLRLAAGRQALGPVRSSVGVTGLVRFGADYAVVPDAIIQQLRDREDPGTGAHRVRPSRQLKPGQNVGISAGPFDGLEGIFERPDGADRVVVLLRLLGREISVGVPRQNVYAGEWA